MQSIYSALEFISIKLLQLGFNATIRKIHDAATIPIINKKTAEYIIKGHNENQAIIESLYDLDLINDKEI